jgi:hypothetical protein
VRTPAGGGDRPHELAEPIRAAREDRQRRAVTGARLSRRQANP